MDWNFPKLKQFLHSLFIVRVDNQNSRKAVKTEGPTIVGDNNVLQINLQSSEDEEKRIQLSDDERKILEKLAEGCKISYVRDGSGAIFVARLFGDNKDLVSDEVVLESLPRLLRKGVIDSHRDHNSEIAEISASGRRIIQWLDLNNK